MHLKLHIIRFFNNVDVAEVVDFEKFIRKEDGNFNPVSTHDAR